MTDDVTMAVEHWQRVAKWPTESMHRRAARVALRMLERAWKAEAERDEARAQVGAARALCATYRCKRCHESSCIRPECHAALGIVRAMDGAKP